jgi:hypothetical protein
MEQFYYRFFDPKGIQRFAVIEAEDEEKALERLRESIKIGFGGQDEGIYGIGKNELGINAYINFGTGNLNKSSIEELTTLWDQEEARRVSSPGFGAADEANFFGFEIIGDGSNTVASTVPPSAPTGHQTALTAEQKAAEARERARLEEEARRRALAPTDPRITEFQRYDPNLEPAVQPQRGFVDFLRGRGVSDPEMRQQFGGRAARPIARRGEEAESIFGAMNVLSQLGAERGLGGQGLPRDDFTPEVGRDVFTGFKPGMSFSKWLEGSGGGVDTSGIAGDRALDILRTLSAGPGFGYSDVATDEEDSLQKQFENLAEGTSANLAAPNRAGIQSIIRSALRGRVSPFFIQRMLPSLLPRLEEQYEQQQWRNQPGRESFTGYLTRRLPTLGMGGPAIGG